MRFPLFSLQRNPSRHNGPFSIQQFSNIRPVKLLQVFPANSLQVYHSTKIPIFSLQGFPSRHFSDIYPAKPLQGTSPANSLQVSLFTKIPYFHSTGFYPGIMTGFCSRYLPSQKSHISTPQDSIQGL
jgi:hypothetical protein